MYISETGVVYTITSVLYISETGDVKASIAVLSIPLPLFCYVYFIRDW